MLPSSVEEGKLWLKAMAGVVRPARVPTTPRWLPPVLPLLIQGGELFLVLMSPCIVMDKRNDWAKGIRQEQAQFREAGLNLQ
jgi:hypothetical protein